MSTRIVLLEQLWSAVAQGRGWPVLSPGNGCKPRRIDMGISCTMWVVAALALTSAGWLLTENSLAHSEMLRCTHHFVSAQGHMA